MAYWFMKETFSVEPLRELEWGLPISGLRGGELNRGKRIEIDVEEPVHFQLESGEGVMPELVTDQGILVTPALAQAFRDCGVDNIDYYDAIIHDSETGEAFTYLLGNVIGVVDIIDLGASKLDPASPPKTAMLFDEIVLDESKAHGLDLFRPLNKKSSLIVSSKVKDHIESLDFPHVWFIAPENKG